MYDIIVIGAGVTGACTARALSKYQVNMCVIEKGDDVCSGTSKANSAIVHGGYDCKPGTLMAKMNVRGNELMYELAEELDFPVKKNGSLIVCTVPEERGKLDVLLQQGIDNGVPGVRIVEKEELLAMEKNLTPNAVAALYVPTGGLVDPFNMNVAFAENAAVNGCEFKFETEVTDIVKKDGYFEVVTDKGTFETKIVVNAAGVYADKMHNFVSEKKMKIIARKGEYLLMDHELGDYFSATVFPLPGKMGKGILTAPTIHGNTLVGPTAIDVPDRESTATTQEGLDQVISRSQISVKNLPLRKVITSFAGLRAHEDRHDFVLGPVEDAQDFYDCAGIESPGLSSAPAIGEYIGGMVAERFCFAAKKEWKNTRKGIISPKNLPFKERNELIRRNPAYGQIICRCENITEGEIIDAIRRPLGACSLDGVKRRVRAGMGRCQGGFCSPRVMDILSRELGLPMEKITKSGGRSNIVLDIQRGEGQ